MTPASRGNENWQTLCAWLLLAPFILSGCGSGKAPAPLLEAESAPADQNIGERLFVETRFAEYFAANMTDVNAPLAVGDPAVSQVQNVYTGPMPGPFAGQSINCRSCHFVVEFQGVPAPEIALTRTSPRAARCPCQ